MATILVYSFIFVIGAIIGSFLNVVILRAFSGESIVLPPSKCPKCNNRLKWWHNIPILSYILLGGKCWFCKEKISVQYPIIEFITGLVFVVVVAKYGLQLNTLFALIVASLLIVISVTDIKEKVVFDCHTYSLIGVGLFFAIFNTVIQVILAKNSIFGFEITKDWILNNPLTISIAGMVCGAVIMELAARLGYVLAKTRAFGEGDSYIAAGLGAVFGLKNMLIILALSVAIQLIFTLPLFIKKLILNKDYIAVLSLGLFFVSAILYWIFKDNIENFALLIFAMVIMLGFGIWAIKGVLKSMKEPSKMMYLPFGPALAIAGFIMLFV